MQKHSFINFFHEVTFDTTYVRLRLSRVTFEIFSMTAQSKSLTVLSHLSSKVTLFRLSECVITGTRITGNLGMWRYIRLNLNVIRIAFFDVTFPE